MNDQKQDYQPNNNHEEQSRSEGVNLSGNGKDLSNATGSDKDRGDSVHGTSERRNQVFFDSSENVMKKIYELDVYILSERLSDLIWSAYDKWPDKVQQSIGNAIVRAADNIAANLSEGYGCYTLSERKLFYRYARGAFEETKAWLRKLTRRNIITDDEVPAYTEIIDELGPKLNAFIKKTK